MTAVAMAVAGAGTVRLASADLQPVTARTQMTGQLLVATGDTFGSAPVLQTSLRTPSGTVRLRIPAAQHEQMAALAGRLVRVRGVGSRGGFDVADIAPAQPSSPVSAANPRAAAPRAMTIAVVLMHPAGTAANVTPRAANRLFFARTAAQQPPSVAQWLSAASGGRLDVAGRVFGDYRSTLPANDCTLSDWLRAGASAARRDGYSSRKYTHLVVYTPARSCPFAGIARIGSSGAYVHGNLTAATAERELGHNLGLWNAGAYSCNPPAPSCLSDYGDQADIMGNASTARDLSAAHKYLLGWLPSANVTTVTGGPQDVVLAASDRPAAAGSTRLLLVPRADGTSFAVESRGGQGAGSATVWVRIVGLAGTDDTEVASPGRLAAGQSFLDPDDAVNIETLSATAAAATVRVCAGDCAARRPAPTTVTTSPPASTTTAVSTTVPAAPVPTTSPPTTPVAPSPQLGLAASREIMWATCDSVVALTDAQLDQWRALGVGGFVCQTQHLAGLGGGQEFTADPNAPLVGPRYDLQRQIRDSGIVARAAARGIKLWMGIYFSNYYNTVTPLDRWFDDAAWSTQLVPKLGDIAGAARQLGFAGLAFDEEQYDGAAWDWDFPGNSHSEAEVRAEVRVRGAQMMAAIVNAFPGVDVIDYGTYFPDGWNALVQQQVNGVQNPYASDVQIDLWNGLTSVSGYSGIGFMDATFYKTAHLDGATWDSAMTYNINRLTAYLSRNLDNWSYASSRVAISPFAWIDGDVLNEGSFTAPRDPAYVAAQLAAFRRWGMGGSFSIFSYASLGEFDYTPYAAGMQAASVPGVIDDQPPTLTVSATARVGSGVVVSGTATDDMAMSGVQWQDGSTGGAAPMTWSVTAGDWRTGYQWHMDWSATVPAAPGDPITITARDSTGLSTTVALTAP